MKPHWEQERKKAITSTYVVLALGNAISKPLTHACMHAWGRGHDASRRSDGGGGAMVMVGGAGDHAAPQAEPAQGADGGLSRRAARLAAPLQRQQPLRLRLHLDDGTVALCP